MDRRHGRHELGLDRERSPMGDSRCADQGREHGDPLAVRSWIARQAAHLQRSALVAPDGSSDPSPRPAISGRCPRQRAESLSRLEGHRHHPCGLDRRSPGRHVEPGHLDDALPHRRAHRVGYDGGIYRQHPVRILMRLLLATVIGASVAGAQTHHPPVGQEGSPNIHVVGHIPLGGDLHVTDIDIEQELARPYVYVSRGVRQPAGFSIISVRDIKHGQADPQLLYEWNIENPELHVGLGALRGRYFKTHGRYYYVQCFQFSQGTPDADLGAIVFDVTGLPDTSKIKEVARIRQPDAPGGFHDVFTYKHSDGRVLLFTSTSAKPYAQIWDMDKLLAGAPNYGFVGRVTNPDRLAQNDHSIVGSFHDYWLGYDPATQQDKFYGAGRGGYYVFDVTKPEEPKLITSITGVMGVTSGHTITPSPDGRYAVTE